MDEEKKKEIVDPAITQNLYTGVFADDMRLELAKAKVKAERIGLITVTLTLRDFAKLVDYMERSLALELEEENEQAR